MNHGKTIQTVETWRCPYCGHQDTAVEATDAGFTLHQNMTDAYLVCDSCGETMNVPH